MVVKTSVSIDEEIIKKVDEYCSEKGLKRSAFIQECIIHEFNCIDAEKSFEVLNRFNADEVYKATKTFADMLAQIQETGGDNQD